MNILLLNYEYPPIGGGASNACYYLARELGMQGHNPVVLTARFGKEKHVEKCKGVTIYRCPSFRKRQDQSNMFEMASYVFGALVYIPKIMKRHCIEGLVVFFSMPCGPLGLYAKCWKDVPYVITLRGGDVPGTEPGLNKLHEILAPMRRLVLRKSITVIANSSGLKNLSECVDPIPVHVIPNGVDTEFFYLKENIKVTVFRFLFVGRFQSQKNLLYLLDNLRLVSQQCQAPFILTIVGDGPLKESVIEYSHTVGIANRVEWVGWCDKFTLRTLYQKADCLINPSLYEGMPNAVLEAMACGLPVIASNVTGNNELVRHGETGYLFDLDKPDVFQSSLKSLLENPDKAREFGLAGRHRVVTEYSWQRVAKAYLALFY
jgi:glycosyltransferase involved in cell wall biosynthesis